MKKIVAERRFADPDAAARKIVEIANGVEAVQNGRIYIERVNAPFLAGAGSGDDFGSGIERAIALGWLWYHESGTYLRTTNVEPVCDCDKVFTKLESLRTDGESKIS